MNDIKEKLCQTGKRILTLSRNELYLSMRFWTWLCHSLAMR